jgi:hypothetical protein
VGISAMDMPCAVLSWFQKYSPEHRSERTGCVSKLFVFKAVKICAQPLTVRRLPKSGFGALPAPLTEHGIRVRIGPFR